MRLEDDAQSLDELKLSTSAEEWVCIGWPTGSKYEHVKNNVHGFTSFEANIGGTASLQSHVLTMW